MLYDSDHVEPKAEWADTYHHIGVPISGLTVEAIGGTAKDKGKNIFALGLIAKMFDLNVPKLTQLVSEKFAWQRPEHLEQRPDRISCRLRLLARQRDRNIPICRKPKEGRRSRS